MEKIPVLVLAAGKGVRFRPLTDTTPKPLLKVINESPIESNLKQVIDKISEIYMVVGYLPEKVKEYFGDEFMGVSIKYIEQTEQLGTGHAIFLAKDLIKTGSFLVLYGDDIYGSEVFEKLWDGENVVVGKKEEKWQNFGVFQLKDEKYLGQVVEKPKEFVGDLVNIGVHKLNAKVFDFFEGLEKSERGELEFTDVLSKYAQNEKIEVVEINSGWTPLSYPWNMLDAVEKELGEMESNILGEVEENVVIKGKVYLGEGAIVKSGAYIEGNFYIGENCVIGPNCYLKGFGVIRKNSVIGNGVELTRSIVGEEVNIRHLSYIGDSLIGNKVNIGGGTMVANLKFNNTTVKVNINGKEVDTGRYKFGAIIGDEVKTGVNSAIYPGAKIYSKVWLLPGEVVTIDKNTGE